MAPCPWTAPLLRCKFFENLSPSYFHANEPLATHGLPPLLRLFWNLSLHVCPSFKMHLFWNLSLHIFMQINLWLWTAPLLRHTWPCIDYPSFKTFLKPFHSDEPLTKDCPSFKHLVCCGLRVVVKRGFHLSAEWATNIWDHWVDSVPVFWYTIQYTFIAKCKYNCTRYVQ